MACDRRLTRLIAPDGTGGVIPDLIARIRKTGARVIYVGYMRSPGRSSPIEKCHDEGDALEARISQYASRDAGVFFVSLADLVPDADLSFHTLDRVHPSVKASRAIGLRIANIIQTTSKGD